MQPAVRSAGRPPPPQEASPDEARRLGAHWFTHAEQAVRRGDIRLAMQLYQRSCAYVPENLLFRQTLRRTVQHRSNGSPGLGDFLGALWLACRAALAYLRSHDARLVAACEQVLVHLPASARALWAQAQALARMGHQEAAIYDLHRLLEIQPDHLAAARQLAFWYEQRGQEDKAAILWDHLRQRQPLDLADRQQWQQLQVRGAIRELGFDPDRMPELSDPEALHTPADLAPEQPPRRETAEIRRLQRQLEADPGNADLYLQLSRRHGEAGQFDAAQRVLAEGVQASGGQWALRERLEELEAHRLRARLLEAGQAARASPDERSAQQRLAVAQTELNDYELDLYRARVDRYPQRKDLNYEFALRLIRAGLLDEALCQLGAAAREPTLAPCALVALACCLQALGDAAQAQQCWEQAAPYWPPDDALLAGSLRRDLSQQALQARAG